MKKILKYLLYFIGFLALVVLGLGLFGPKKLDLTRSILIKANRQTVWNQVADWKNFNHWSPWSKMDTGLTWTTEGTPMSVGAKYIWKSKKLGNGSLETKEIKPMDYHMCELTFEEMSMKSQTSYTLKDSAGGTFIVWNMSGENNFMGKVMSGLGIMQKMLGGQFEDGLNALKKHCEEHPETTQAKFKLGTVEVKKFPKTIFAQVRKTYTRDEFNKGSKEAFGKGAGTLFGYAKKNNIQITGPMYGLYYEWSEKPEGKVDFSVAFPVNKKGTDADGVTFITSDGAECAAIDYWGPYEGIGNAHMALDKWFKDNYKTQGGPVLEEYVTDPSTEKDMSKWLTRIWYPIK